MIFGLQRNISNTRIAYATLFVCYKAALFPFSRRKGHLRLSNFTQTGLTYQKRHKTYFYSVYIRTSGCSKKGVEVKFFGWIKSIHIKQSKLLAKPSNTMIIVKIMKPYPNAPVVADLECFPRNNFNWLSLSPCVSILVPLVTGPV